MKLPSFVADVLQVFEQQTTPLMELEIHEGLAKARGKRDLDDLEWPPFQAEVCAFLFGERRAEDSVWGTYFAPMMTATRDDGSEFRAPNIEELRGETVEHWKERASF